MSADSLTRLVWEGWHPRAAQELVLLSGQSVFLSCVAPVFLLLLVVVPFPQEIEEVASCTRVSLSSIQ